MNTLAMLSAIITIGFGVLCLAAPRFSLNLIHLQTKPERPEAVAEGRATLAGFYLAAGGLALFAPSFGAYSILALGWLFTAAGRIASIFLDNGRTNFNIFSAALELALGLSVLPAMLQLGRIVIP